jgi:hypothetical protein
VTIAHQPGYAKLQVGDRSSAVRRARELRLLAAVGRTREPGDNPILLMRRHLPGQDA